LGKDDPCAGRTEGVKEAKKKIIIIIKNAAVLLWLRRIRNSNSFSFLF